MGDIFVGGAQVGVGCLNRSDARARFFVEDLFCYEVELRAETELAPMIKVGHSLPNREKREVVQRVINSSRLFSNFPKITILHRQRLDSSLVARVFCYWGMSKIKCTFDVAPTTTTPKVAKKV